MPKGAEKSMWLLYPQDGRTFVCGGCNGWDKWSLYPPAFHQIHVLPASLMLRASSLESNLANFLVLEICLSEQDFTVVVTFPGALSSRSLLHKSK